MGADITVENKEERRGGKERKGSACGKQKGCHTKRETAVIATREAFTAPHHSHISQTKHEIASPEFTQ
jgi:hypothetical protein